MSDQGSGAIRFGSEAELMAVALALIGNEQALSAYERSALKGVEACSESDLVESIRASIESGADPLGQALIQLRSPETRRRDGAVYTPGRIIDSMLAWAADQGRPERVIDPGAGSGRFLIAAAKCFPDASLVGVEVDPRASVLLRANLSVLGLSHRSTVLIGDYRKAPVGRASGPTLFVGNPPYVRHHEIDDKWKAWFAKASAKFGIRASKLAGLHIHFFVRTLELAQSGDFGAFITSAEWLDVNYGGTLRDLLADGLGGVGLHVFDASAAPFADATTTGAITCFLVNGNPENLLVRSVENVGELGRLSTGRSVPWHEVRMEARWSNIIRPGPPKPRGFVELGELCRVHRGQVTGGNAVWIQGPETEYLPASVLMPTVTKAKELFAAGAALRDRSGLRRVVDLPEELDGLSPEDLEAVQRFLKWARRQGAHRSYIARHRRAWWSVGLKEPAPIIATYMARRPPTFVRNVCAARHINIAHGLYPRDPLGERVLDALARWLRENVGVSGGRTYAGGLTKYEPKELERVAVPSIENLQLTNG